MNAYADRLATIHRALGIPENYAAARALSLQPEADESALVAVSAPPGERAVRLTAATAAAWTRMRAAAEADGFALLLLSGFRGVERQAEIIRGKLAAGRSLADILRFVAAPGYSEHHTGRALDLGVSGMPPLEESFAETGAFRWLQTHAADFAFFLTYPRENTHHIAYEPWHWCWRG